MSENEEMVQLVVEVPKETKEVAKRNLEYGGLSREVRNTLARIAHGEETAELQRVKDNLEDLRDKRSELKQSRDEIENKLSDIERKIERNEKKLDRLRDMESEYEGRLMSIEEQMIEDEIRVFHDHGQILSVAQEYGLEPIDVINDLQERNPDLPDKQFRSGI